MDAGNRRLSFAEKVKANASMEIDVSKFLVGRLDFQRIKLDSVHAIAAEKWRPQDFDPNIQRITHAMVLVKFLTLKQQYLDYEILMSMGRCIGYPIGLDKPTAEREFGFYASVLVDLDLSKHIPNQILVELPNGVDFMQEAKPRIRQSKYFIEEIKTDEGIILQDQCLMKEYMVQAYKAKFEAILALWN
ncbi:hypothetical protein IFM89_017419 [Coptis chinensis]|uniref:Uncharacterized protein n=1 Tax=Coptis chinensis TaxID=261450 RepID=A0A835HMS2_9MAGN|nr:hypothetical protein IFM89_017419 [Coptis chinensis]